MSKIRVFRLAFVFFMVTVLSGMLSACSAFGFGNRPEKQQTPFNTPELQKVHSSDSLAK